MQKMLLAWMALPLIMPAVAARADLAQKLSEELIQQSVGVTTVNDAVKAAAQARPVVWVAGILNESMRWYFQDNIESLKDELGQADSTVIFPSSQKGLLENGAIVAQKIRAAFEAHDRRPLMVIAHSKGAAETLLALLNDPTLLQDGAIDRLVFLHAALGGSKIADLLENDDAGDYDAADFFHWIFHDWQGLQALTTRSEVPLIQNALAAAPADVKQKLASLIYYVRGAQKREQDVTLMIRLMYHFIATQFGPNDGVLMPDEEWIPGLGTDLGILDDDHGDLVWHGLATNMPDSYRHAFTRALYRQLFEQP